MREHRSITEEAPAPQRAASPTLQGTAGELLALQSSAGNAAVARMLARRESLSITVPAAMAGDLSMAHERQASVPFVREAGEDASGVDQSDIHQGAVGDCFFLSPLMALSRINPGRIARMIRTVRTEDDGRVIYEVTINAPVGGGSWGQRGFLLDDRFVTDASGGPRYAGYGDTAVGGAREIWVMLMEKAWAAAKGSYQGIHFGNAEDGLRAVTGHGGTWAQVASKSAAEIVGEIERGIDDGRPVICNTPKTFNAAQTARATALGLRLVPSHSYNASWASSHRGQLDIRNPHGINHLIDLDVADFRLFFEWYLIADRSAR
jgi:hypothetical protein